MSASETYDRFEELDAGRALGDLSSDEFNKLKKLSNINKTESSLVFDWIITELELKNS